jgi:hypothetical protein
LQSPHSSKRPTCRRYGKCRNGFRAKRQSPKSVLTAESGYSGSYAASHRGRFAISAPIETRDVSQICLWGSGFRAGGKAPKSVLIATSGSWAGVWRLSEADSQSPCSAKCATCRRCTECENGFREGETAEERPDRAKSSCLGVCAPPHRGRFAITAPIEPPNVLHKCQIRKRVCA